MGHSRLSRLARNATYDRSCLKADIRRAATELLLEIEGLRVNEWVILGLKARQTGALRRTFALRLGSEFAMNVGWHEH